ncbi:MAG: type I methionyl aminopeptidase [Burkholderiales bacterium]|jgi:methionyl aminopeptidase|nr:type I methionyl aminopeptidase [Burkholderiales bacterium]
MIRYKSESEIEAIRHGGRILRQTLELVNRHCVPGVRTQELDQMAEQYIREQGGKPSFKGYRGFPGSLCISINEEVVHGIPGRRKLREGDLVSVDCGVTWEGFVADSATTIAVGEVEPELQKLMDITRESLYLGIDQARPGNFIRDISKAVQDHVEKNGFTVVRDLVGHGVGHSVHEEPQVPNFVGPRKGPKILPGLVIAIEPMVNVGTCDVVMLADNWTIVTRDRLPSAHFEHTIAVTENGPRILTNGD